MAHLAASQEGLRSMKLVISAAETTQHQMIIIKNKEVEIIGKET
jgi:hypothetical protein